MPTAIPAAPRRGPCDGGEAAHLHPRAHLAVLSPHVGTNPVWVPPPPGAGLEGQNEWEELAHCRGQPTELPRPHLCTSFQQLLPPSVPNAAGGWQPCSGRWPNESPPQKVSAVPAHGQRHAHCETRHTCSTVRTPQGGTPAHSTATDPQQGQPVTEGACSRARGQAGAGGLAQAPATREQG